MTTEPNHDMVRVIVAHGRSVAHGDEQRRPGEEMFLEPYEALRLIDLGFVIDPDMPAISIPRIDIGPASVTDHTMIGLLPQGQGFGGVQAR
jgi:hypothetical protein